MQKDKGPDADASGLPESESPFGPDDSSGGFQRSAKLKEKLRKLAKWRLDRSPIEFSKDAPEFRGGNATVSRAALVSPLSSPTEKDPSCPTKSKRTDSDGHEGEASGQRKSIAVKKMNISGDRARVLGLALREAEFLVDISHENVIEFEGFVEDLSNDTIWLVFPWAENGTLRDFIAAADWDIPERISLINDVTGGVEYLHSRQPPLRHGDLKSMNILVGSDCRARISDFGSARRLSAKDLDKETSQADNKPQEALSLEATFCSSNDTIAITLTGDSYTLRWAAPEVLREEEASLGSDIWSLGWVAYEVMTNSIPFQDVVKDAIVIRRIIQGDLPSLTHDARMSLIQTLCSLMLACWCIDPRKRPTAQDCRRSISGMPMILPSSIRITEIAAPRNRSPALLMQLGHMHRRQSDYANALDFFTNALSKYQDMGDRQGNAMAQVQLAQVHWFRYEYCQAATFYSEALQILTEIGDRQGRAFALCGLAEVHRLQNQYNQAVTLYSEALQIRTDVGDPPGIAQALLGLADVYRHRNEYGQAVTFYSDALRIRTDIGDRRGRADALWGLAEVHRLRNEYNQAIMLNSEALKIYTDIGDRLGRAGALLNLADVHRDQGDYGEAICRYTEATEIFEQIGDTWNAAYALSEVDEVLRSSEREEATCLLEELEIRHSSG